MTTFSIETKVATPEKIIEKMVTHYQKYLHNPKECYNVIYEEIKDYLGIHTIKIWNRECLEPRMGAFFSIGGVKGYSYSKSKRPTFDLLKYPVLKSLADKVSEFLGVRFNSCLINLYRDGKDYIGEHSDDERDLVKSNIASISLGATRDFFIKSKSDKSIRYKIPLVAGSLVHMYGDCQKYYKHSLPKRMRCKEPRLNITFRVIDIK